MTEYERMSYQRAISEAYRMSDVYVPFAIRQLSAMIDTLICLEPKTPEEVHTAAMAVIEEFSNDRSSAPEGNKSIS